VDRRTAARAIALGPLVGLLLGAGAAAVAWLSHAAGLPSLLVGLLVVASLLLGTRGMHIDGLADTLDGLGCYGPPARAREVMRGGGAGPFGVAAVVVALGGQAAAFGALADAHRWLALVLAVAAGRVAVVAACRRGTPAGPDAAFGALVADSQPAAIPLGWTLALLVGSVWAIPGQVGWNTAELAAVLLLPLTFLLVRHCARRFDGLSGDVLGACVEITTTAYAVLCCVRTVR
jgi:adenosylcobinamide-GDP ribazoletransferase